MRDRFLSKLDVKRLSRCPDEVPQADLDTHFQLSRIDEAALTHLRGDANRLGFALQLCCLRYLGFFPASLVDINEPIVGYVADQLGVNPGALEAYGRREKTFNAHQRQAMQHLGYRRATPTDLLNLERWLLDRALEHDKPKLLFELGCDFLHRNKVVRIGVTRLARRVGHARQQAEQVTFERLRPFLTGQHRAFLDSLLSPEEEGRTSLTWLQRTPSSNQTSAIVHALDKLAFLRANGVNTWDLRVINPNRLKWLAKRGSRASPQGLRELKEQARHSVLAAFLLEALYTFRP